MRSTIPEKRMMKHKKGLWSPDEDQKLTYYVLNHGHGFWSSVPINAAWRCNLTGLLVKIEMMKERFSKFLHGEDLVMEWCLYCFGYLDFRYKSMW
ncbi:hypothetical protein L1987_24775 [Smallanthus sonchifolius]|uniref:Uncharacterized protein n=1 Tax=Smallanthus sonchifolius TaxID=185202 RepID=A0ACB9ILC3_9ASTR|nr:hypothetical protein L1987_24775 [Smallanthus sonchifolius]